MTWRHQLAVLLNLIWVLGSADAKSPDLASAEAGTTDLVFVTEDTAFESPGCDAVSVFDASQRTALHRGETHISPGRLAASSDYSVVLATQTNTIAERFVYTLVRRGDDLRRWTTGSLTGPNVATFGGITFLPGDTQILLATAGGPNPPPLSNLAIHAPNSPPYEVRKYTLPPSVVGDRRLTRHEGSVRLDGVAVEVFASSDGRTAYVVTDVDTVHTVDVLTMSETDAPISVAGFEGPPGPWQRNAPRLRHATITRDERYLVTNRWSRDINVVDLETRRTWTLPVSDDVTSVGGVALNGGWVNPNLLAVHAGRYVIVYEFSPGGPLRELSRTAIAAPVWQRDNGPQRSIAWSGSGKYVIAATDQGGAQFVVVEVSDGGSRASIKHTIAACTKGPYNLPNDVLTMNDLPWPTPTPTVTLPPSPTSTLAPPTGTPTLIPTQTTGPTNTPTVTASPTLTPTPTPRPLYLPLLLREHCTPDKQRADVALVIDASSSMLLSTSTGRTKLSAATEAAGVFLDQLQLNAGDQAAIVAFNADAWLLQPLTADRHVLDTALASIQSALQTCLVCGVDVGADELASERRDLDNTPVMVVLTDGLSNPRPASEAVTRAAKAKRQGVMVYTIGLGDTLDFVALEQIATKPEGFYRTPDAEELAGIYRQIAVEIPCPAGKFWPWLYGE